ncbi:unnamed protein product [Hydatigera taeniaeformis]|uniref:MANSC domain-containing protein n=1 Tax=Hydatigena taeniaeformis TaxID=6205 RepID=A0A0R3X1L6_HYDTA|nr:unnamed protein product [Hydatigera taeniaeformis]
MGSVSMFSISIQLFALFITVFSRKCDKDFDIHINTIILTHVSDANGAPFIRKPPAHSLVECIEYCCDTSECTVGVFGPKEDDKCFLFNCFERNMCNFTSESGYTVFMQRTLSHELSNVPKFAMLSSGSFRTYCGPKNPCVIANSICDSGQCVCKPGFIEKRRKCVPSICSKPELEFQCDDATTCIAVYDVCNGIVECPDASDESFCEKEITRASSIRKVGPPRFSGTHVLNARTLLPHDGAEHSLSEVVEPFKMRSVRPPHFVHDNPVRRIYQDKKEYKLPGYRAPSLETNVPSLMVSEAQEKSIFPDDIVNTFLERPERLRSQFADDDTSVNNHWRKIGRHTLFRDFGEKDGIHSVPYHRWPDLDREHKVLRHTVRPFPEHSGNLYFQRNVAHFSAKSSAASAIGFYSQSGYQWHTAAILLAIGLGLTSCLFGLLVGRCRQRGRFNQGGPRSKAVATSHLRQRIMRTRGLSNNDLERSGLLSKLQL